MCIQTGGARQESEARGNATCWGETATIIRLSHHHTLHPSPAVIIHNHTVLSYLHHPPRTYNQHVLSTRHTQTPLHVRQTPQPIKRPRDDPRDIGVSQIQRPVEHHRQVSEGCAGGSSSVSVSTTSPARSKHHRRQSRNQDISSQTQTTTETLPLACVCAHA